MLAGRILRAWQEGGKRLAQNLQTWEKTFENTQWRKVWHSATVLHCNYKREFLELRNGSFLKQRWLHSNNRSPWFFGSVSRIFVSLSWWDEIRWVVKYYTCLLNTVPENLCDYFLFFISLSFFVFVFVFLCFCFCSCCKYLSLILNTVEETSS